MQSATQKKMQTLGEMGEPRVKNVPHGSRKQLGGMARSGDGDALRIFECKCQRAKTHRRGLACERLRAFAIGRFLRQFAAFFVGLNVARGLLGTQPLFLGGLRGKRETQCGRREFENRANKTMCDKISVFAL